MHFVSQKRVDGAEKQFTLKAYSVTLLNCFALLIFRWFTGINWLHEKINTPRRISKKSVIEVEINSTYLNMKPNEQSLPFYMKYTWIHENPAYLKSIWDTSTAPWGGLKGDHNCQILMRRDSLFASSMRAM